MNRRGISRRDLLRTAGLAAAGAALAGCGEDDPYALPKPPVPGAEGWHKGRERWVATSCGHCQAGCGVRVRVVEGRAVKIEGLPGCPLNRGGLGPKGQAGLQLLYHPDRIRGPLRRDGPRGSGQWKRVPWEEAFEEIGRTLRELRSRGEPQSLLVVDGDPRGTSAELWERFLEAYGSPNHANHRSVTDGGKVLAMAYMHGVPELPAYDWDSTRYVLGFGASLFESWCQTIHLARASSQLRRGMPGRRVKFVQVSARFSVTAAKADEWVPIEPATYGALALGLAHVLIREELHDAELVREHTFGFEDWKDADGRSRRGFRDLVTKDYPPEKVAGITGVRVATIERLAREMTEHYPAVALADGGAAAATNGLGTAMAIHALNALLGNLERPGGILVQRSAPLAPWPLVEQDEAARKGRGLPRLDGAGGPSCPLGQGYVQGLPEAILSGKPYPVQALVLYKSNPVFSKPDGRRWIEALRKVPLVVSCSPLPDESTFWADFVLPESTYLERWELVEPVPSVGHPIAGLRQPVVRPLHETLSGGDLVIRLAKALGAPVAGAFPWDDLKAAGLERLKGLAEAKTGSIVEPKLTKLRDEMQKAGGWWAPGYSFEDWDSAFRTPSRKFEFFSQAIAARLAQVFPDPEDLEARLDALGVATRGDDLCLPHWEPPRFAGDPAEFPFVLVVYRGIDHAEGGARHLPWLRELPAAGRAAWKERVEVHPADAEGLGIADGDRVVVESPAGRKILTAQVQPGTRPGTLGIPLGHGEWPPDPAAQGQAGGMALLVSSSDPLAGILALQGTRARIRKDGAA
ncbi:MAG: molybdopterin-dependent oxidoreductase [Planctomycetes bacterium]|nr:molybdopterin-dependent oxidoreductase [Planctomycetota bacterium]